VTLKGKAKAEYMRDYMRRRRAEQAKQPKPKPAAASAAVALLEARIRELEAELARRKAQDRAAIKLAGSARSGREVFSEAGRLRAEIGKLKSDISKLRAALAEEPDAVKLRKKVVEQRVEMANLRTELRRVAKERDKYRAFTQPKFREASRLLTRQNYRLIVKALHSDRAKLVTPDELATAERVATALGPLFESH